MCGETAQKANMFRQISLARRVKKESEIAISIDPRHINARFLLVMFYMNAPGIMGGDKKKAHDIADEMVRLNPVEGYFAQARIAGIEKNSSGVEAAYLKAAEANAQNYQAQVAMANFYAADTQKKYDLAEKYARAALKIDATRAGAYGILAIVLGQNQRISELETLLAQSEKNVPDNLNPFYQAGRVMLLTGKEFPRAESYFRKYISQEPEAGAPNHGAAHWRLGLVLEKLGRKQEAIAEVEKAVQTQPNLEDAKKDLKRMKPS